MKLEELKGKVLRVRDSLKEMWDEASTRQKFAFITLGGLIVAYPGVSKLSKSDKEKDKAGLDISKNSLFLVEVDSDKKGIELLDKEGKSLEYQFTDSTLAIIGSKSSKSKSGKMVEVALVSENGDITLGYMDGKYLIDQSLDEIEVEGNLFDIFNISSTDSLSLNESDKENSNEQRVLLAPKSEVLAAKIANTEKASTKLLREVLLVHNKKFVKGYLDHRYLFNSSFFENNEKDYRVEDTLNLRETPDTNSDNKICQIPTGAIVKAINNVKNVDDGDYEWTYVAYLEGEHKNVQFGWIVRQDYSNGDINITEVTSENTTTISSEDKVMQLYVSLTDDALNMRSTASLNADVIAKLAPSTELFTTLNAYHNPIKVDNIEWIYVKLTDGTPGYVSKEYVNIVDKSTVDIEDYKTGALDFGRYGSHVGNFGIDINIDTDADALDSILKNGIQFNKSQYVSSTDTYKPTFVVIKCGATGYGADGDMRFGTIYNSEGSNYEELISVCQRNNVPFAIYYFSQATSENEAKAEVDVISKAHSIASKYSLYSKNIFMDFECYGYDGSISEDTRIKVNADKFGKDVQTEVANKVLNIASSTIPDADVRIYTDANTLQTTLDITKIDSKYLSKYNWIVNTGDFHQDKLVSLGIPSDIIGMFQIAVDVPCTGTFVDLNFMYEEYYKEFISDIKDNLVQESSNTESSTVISEPNLTSKSCVVIDPDTNNVIYGVNEDSMQSPASITKILSCFIALKYGDIDDYITYTDETVFIDHSTKYPSDGYNSAYPNIVFVGNKIKVRDALRLALYKSDNSTTYALEKYIEKKCDCNFIDLMNQEAKTMGCENYNFTNSFGYEDPNHLVSAHDMALIMSYILNNPTKKGAEIFDIMSEKSYTFTDGTITIESQNNPYYNETKGIKTGGHDMAGGTIVEFVKRGDKTLVAVNMGTDVGASYEKWDNLYVEENQIIDYAFSKLNNNNIEPCMYTPDWLFDEEVGNKKLVMTLMRKVG